MSRFARVEAWLERIGDRLNPILVKECRQALKSRQFTGVFALVLLGCWFWSLFGVAMIGPSLNFGGGGAGLSLFYGYFMILAFPLIVIVPYGAFRSLAEERDDRTYELMAITTLRPRQIVSGKLGSALVQMLVYVSAVTPCLGFTYLLRGVEAPLILFALAGIVLTSVGLSLAALLASTVAHERIWQTIWSGTVVVGLVLLFILSFTVADELIRKNQLPYDEIEFWYVCAACLATYASYCALLFLAAAASLSFVGENRSTPLKIVMVLQQLLLTFVLVWAAVHISPKIHGNVAMMLLEVSGPYAMVLMVHWYVMGALLTTEAGQLSNRAKRQLPQSFVGRALFTWFNPGPACGYVFALANLTGAWLLILAVSVAADIAISGGGGGFVSSIARQRWGLAAAPLSICYVAIYLGIGRAAISLLRAPRRWERRRPWAFKCSCCSSAALRPRSLSARNGTFTIALNTACSTSTIRSSRWRTSIVPTVATGSIPARSWRSFPSRPVSCCSPICRRSRPSCGKLGWRNRSEFWKTTRRSRPRHCPRVLKILGNDRQNRHGRHFP